jgi:peptide/nickel transport system permease protein
MNVTPGSLVDRLVHIILPASMLSLAHMASWSRYMRSSMLEVLRQDYVRTARAKGVSPRGVLLRHVLRNAMIPILTNVIIAIPFLYTGALLLESFFGIPGLGRLTVNALFTGDEDVIFATTFIGAILFVVANVVTDIAYAWADPRIRFR